MKWCQKKNQLETVSPLEQQAQKLAELGNRLRLKRRIDGVSLEEVAAKTRIQQRILEAIEAGKLDELPEPVYVQSFIKQYADLLELNELELLPTTFTNDANPNQQQPIGGTGKALLKDNPILRQLTSKLAGIRLPAVPLRPIHLYLFYILLIGSSVNVLSRTLNHSELQVSRSQSQNKPLSTPTAKPDVLPPSDKLKPVSNTHSTTTKTNKPVQVDVTTTAATWIRVIADGKKQFEGLLPQGTQRTWVAQDQLTVRVGNAGGVMVTYNQQQAKQLGNTGEVQEVTFANPRT